MCTQVLQIGISKEKFKLWLMVERERERETHRRRGEGEGKGLLNCCFPVPAEKWGWGEGVWSSWEYWKTCVLDNSEWLMTKIKISRTVLK